MRRLPAATGGRVVIGLLRLTSATQPVRVRQISPGAPLPELSLLYVPGDDESGRHDAYLASDASSADRKLFETTAGDDIFTFRFNRVRERGRGWVMAGFEVIEARRRILRPSAHGGHAAPLLPSVERAVTPPGETEHYFGER